MANEVDGQNREDVERQGLAKHFVSLRFTHFEAPTIRARAESKVPPLPANRMAFFVFHWTA